MERSDLDVEIIFQQGRAAWLRNDPAEAARLLQQAHNLAPENGAIAYALGSALLKSGELLSGYPLLNRWRTHNARIPRLPIPSYSGQPLVGKHLLIWGEDGFGDQIMYSRFAVDFLRCGATVSWFCPRPLARLFNAMGICALPNDEPFTLSGIDYYCGSSSLPEAIQLTIPDISGTPFINIEPQEKGIRTGVMTFASPHHKDGADRSLDPAASDRLLSIQSAINLDPSATGAVDFLDTANIIANLSRVITVDTSVAHLSGAMGVDTIILLPFVGDWKWFNNREDSPWYNSVRLARQQRIDNWSSALDRALEFTMD